jgi:hypothetical protein
LQNLDDDHARESLVYVRNALSAYRTEINYVKNSANSGFFQPSVLKRDKISDVKLVELNNQLFSDATHSTYGIGGSQGGIHVWNVVDIGSNIYEVHWGDGPRDKELFEGEEAYSEAEDRNIEGYAWTYGFVTVPPEQAT